jgi:4'-phosphopantetheinyl transferase
MSSANRSDQGWRPASADWRLPTADEAFALRISLANVDDNDMSCLAQEELDRASRLLFLEGRRAFIQGRLFLRRTLARILEKDPRQLAFGSEGNGKPTLVDSDLAFNLSHSGGEAILVVSGSGPVGVDIEVVSDERDLTGLAERYFAREEVERFRSLEPKDRTAGFYRCWTRKEAFVKAIGEGLSRPLDSFVVSVGPDEPPAFIRIGDDPAAIDEWQLHDLELSMPLAGALVTPAAVTRLTRFTLDRI